MKKLLIAAIVLMFSSQADAQVQRLSKADNMTVDGVSLGVLLNSFPTSNLSNSPPIIISTSTGDISASNAGRTTILKNQNGVTLSIPSATATGTGSGFGTLISNQGGTSTLSLASSRLNNNVGPLFLLQNTDCTISSNGSTWDATNCPIWDYNPTFSTGVMTVADNRLTLAKTSTISCRYINASKQVAYTAAGSCEGRIEYDVNTGVNKGIAIEPQRTNLTSYAVMSATGWTANASATLTGTATMNGKSLPIMVMSTAAYSGFALKTANRPALTAGLPYTISLPVKRISGLNTMRLWLDSTSTNWGASAPTVTFNPSTCAFVAAGPVVSAYDVSAHGDGCKVSFVATPTSNVAAAVVEIYAADGLGGSVAVDAVQIEQGSFATSPIETSGTILTRNEDAVSLDNPYWFSSTAGTLRFEFYTRANTSGGHILSDNTADRALLYINASGNFASKDGTNTVDYALAVPAAGTKNKVCLRYGGGKSNVCVNGSCGTEKDFDGWDITGFNFFRDYAGNNKLYGNAPQNVFWNSTVYTDAECAAWTGS